MMAGGTRVMGTRARSATCPVYDASCPPKTALRTAEDSVADRRCSAVGADQGRSCEAGAVREVGDHLVAVLLEVLEAVIERNGVRVVLDHGIGQCHVQVGPVQIAVTGAELGHE